MSGRRVARLFPRARARRAALVGTALAVALTTAACTGDAEPDPQPDPSPTQGQGGGADKPRKIVFGAYGSEEEVAAFQSVVDSFNASSTTRQVSLRSWPDHESALADVLAGDAPDAFLTSRIDLDQLVDAEALQPVSLLLDERGVDFGDRFSRDAVDAFAMDDELQCMAYSVSPMVVYYNTDIVDFDRMERRELDVPTPNDDGVRERWTLAEFGAAATFAARRGDRRGVWIDPTLRGLAPFIYSGGGQVFDDDREPTSLAFSDDGTREALEQTLEILRDPTLTPTNAQLARATPVQLFKRGELAMVAGFRNLVPELREAEDLEFDVMPMPTIEDRATVGDIAGLCISAESDHVGDAADFIVYAVSDDAIADGRRDGLHRPGQHPGRRLRRLPGPRPGAGQLGRLQLQHPLHGRPALHRPARRARRRGHAAARPARHRAGDPRPRAGDRGDRHRLACGALPRGGDRGDRVADRRPLRVAHRVGTWGRSGRSIGPDTDQIVPRYRGTGYSGAASGSTSAPRMAPTSAPVTSSACQGRAPYDASWARTASASPAGSRVSGGVHSSRRR